MFMIDNQSQNFQMDSAREESSVREYSEPSILMDDA